MRLVSRAAQAAAAAGHQGTDRLGQHQANAGGVTRACG